MKAVLFDFGGVIAEEGFREGLKAIAGKNGLDPDSFYRLGLEIMWSSKYVVGQSSESCYWSQVRKESGIQGTDETLTREILERFKIRPEVLQVVRNLAAEGIAVAILSDQTDWLERLDCRDHFFSLFDHVFNSYYLKKSKRDASLFSDVVNALGILPGEALFIDDSPANVERARMAGLHAILYVTFDQFIRELGSYISDESE